jgi:3-oxoadipate enol-lactonase
MGIVRHANSLEPLGDATMERWFTDAFKAKNPKRWKQIRETIVATTPAGYLGCCAAILGFDFTARLGGVRVPTLVVCGSEDPGTPAAENKKLAGLVPGARYEEIAGMRHFPNVEAPDAFNHIMLGWLEAQKRPS